MEMREQILQAGAEVVAEKGFDRTSVREIARRAGVAVGTLYIYFPSKDAILEAFVETLAQDTAAAGEQAAKVSTPAALEKFLAARADFFIRNSGFLRAVVGRAMFDENLAQMLARNLLEPLMRAIRTAAKGAGLSPTKTALRLCCWTLLDAAVGEPLGVGVSAKTAASTAVRILGG